MNPRFTLVALAAMSLGGMAAAHPDDPKALDKTPPYMGPGWCAAQGGIAGDFPSNNVFLQSWVTLGEFTNYSGVLQESANDCWGYVSPSGREYAIIGLQLATAFVEVSNPANAVIIDVKPGPESTWRDTKVYQTFAYSVSEAGEGIQVFDLSEIDAGVVHHLTSVTEGGTEASHNVAINEASGFLYRTGGGSNGLRMYDLSDPASPQFVATWPDRYVHDAQIHTMTQGPWAGREIAFCCSGFGGGGIDTGIDILDVTDKGDIQLLARYLYPSGAYSHQGWLTTDEQYFLLNDEADESNGLVNASTIHVIDVSDLENPFEAATFNNGQSAITHNIYTRGNRAYSANYSSGLRVFDVTSPLNSIEMAYFDTSGTSGFNFAGLWSNYPLLPSGIVLGSDRQGGLFVWIVDPPLMFSYPGGLPDLLDPAGATVNVQIEELSGTLIDGSATMHYRLEGGGAFDEVTLSQVESGLFEALFPAIPACGSRVEYYFSAETVDGQTWRDPIAAPNVTHVTTVADSEFVAFSDDFETDLGWTVENSPGFVDGAWERGDPVGGGDRGDPPADADGSGSCYLTDNTDGNSDVDGGTTTLQSPVLSAVGESGFAHLVYSRWYSNNIGGVVDDVLSVEVSNDDGQSWTIVEQVPDTDTQWIFRSVRVGDFVTPTDEMRVRFLAGDTGAASIVEAGIDAVRIVFYECEPTNTPDINGDGFVNVQDLVALISAWGDCPALPDPCPADIDGDGEVGVGDLVFLITSWS